VEKRWCKRISVSMKVEIHHNGSMVSRCSVKDISLCGLGLFSGPVAFYKYTKLKIKFPDTNLMLGTVDTINAIVVRNSSHDIGLMFAPTEPELLNPIIRFARREAQDLLAAARMS